MMWTTLTVPATACMLLPVTVCMLLHAIACLLFPVTTCLLLPACCCLPAAACLLLPAEACHFLRLLLLPACYCQDEADMSIIVNTLKLKLGAWGWAEVIRRDKQAFKIPTTEVRGGGGHRAAANRLFWGGGVVWCGVVWQFGAKLQPPGFFGVAGQKSMGL